MESCLVNKNLEFLREIEQAVSNLRNNKTPRSDGVTIEMLKLLGGKGAKILWKLYNEV